MPSRRVQRTAEAIREVVSMAILAELQDPRVRDVTVTYVEVSGDLRQAKVHVSVMGDENRQNLSLRGLQHAAGFLQSKIAERVDLRYTPRLKFELDQGVKQSIKIAQKSSDSDSKEQFMAPVSRTAQFAKVSKVLKKHYKAVIPDPERPVLEYLLLACCLEDCHYELAEDAYAALKRTFFDLNEIRVTSISELSEVMAVLPDSRTAANRLKRVLQAVFEADYKFDLEDYRKKNLGPTIKWLRQLDGTTNFSVAYVVQAALGGHSIPVDSGTLKVLRICDLVTEKNVKAREVPGLERAVSKAKGIEFGSMLHQCAAEFTANPYSPTVRQILLSINPDAKDRFPKRRAARMKKKAEGPQADTGKSKKNGDDEGKAAAQTKKAVAEGKKKTRKTAAGQEGPAPPQETKPATAGKKASAKKKSPDKADSSKKSPAAKGLSKRKPR